MSAVASGQEVIRTPAGTGGFAVRSSSCAVTFICPTTVAPQLAAVCAAPGSCTAATFVYGLFYFLIIGVYGIDGVPRSIGVIQPMLLFFSHISLRLAFKYLLKKNLFSSEISI